MTPADRLREIAGRLPAGDADFLRGLADELSPSRKRARGPDKAARDAALRGLVAEHFGDVSTHRAADALRTIAGAYVASGWHDDRLAGHVPPDAEGTIREHLFNFMSEHGEVPRSLSALYDILSP